MKKKISILLAIMMISVFAFAACGDEEESKFVGTWNAVYCEANGQEVPVEEVLGSFSFELRDDMTVTVTVGEESEDGEWEELEESSGILIDGTKEFLENEDGELVLEQDGVIVFFEK